MSSGKSIQVIVLGEVACQGRNQHKSSQSRGVFCLRHAIRLFGLKGRFLKPRPSAVAAMEGEGTVVPANEGCLTGSEFRGSGGLQSDDNLSLMQSREPGYG